MPTLAITSTNIMPVNSIQVISCFNIPTINAAFRNTNADLKRIEIYCKCHQSNIESPSCQYAKTINCKYIPTATHVSVFGPYTITNTNACHQLESLELHKTKTKNINNRTLVNLKVISNYEAIYLQGMTSLTKLEMNDGSNMKLVSGNCHINGLMQCPSLDQMIVTGFEGFKIAACLTVKSFETDFLFINSSNLKEHLSCNETENGKVEWSFKLFPRVKEIAFIREDDHYHQIMCLSSLDLGHECKRCYWLNIKNTNVLFKNATKYDAATVALMYLR